MMSDRDYYAALHSCRQGQAGARCSYAAMRREASSLSSEQQRAKQSALAAALRVERVCAAREAWRDTLVSSIGGHGAVTDLRLLCSRIAGPLRRESEDHLVYHGMACYYLGGMDSTPRGHEFILALDAPLAPVERSSLALLAQRSPLWFSSEDAGCLRMYRLRRMMLVELRDASTPTGKLACVASITAAGRLRLQYEFDSEAI